VVFGLMEMLAAMSPTYWLFAVSLFPLGVTALTVITTANAYVQTFVDAEMRGRVTALYLMVFMGGTPAGAPMIGWLAEVLGPRWSMIGGGLLTAAGAVLVAVVFARRDGVTLGARLRPRAGFTVGSMS
jgi:MFS family permease